MSDDLPAIEILDDEPGRWFLVSIGGELHLDARYSYSALIDDSALLRLDEGELARYRDGGHAFLSELAERVHMNGPYRPESPYYARDLTRQAGGAQLRAAITAAIVAQRERSDDD